MSDYDEFLKQVIADRKKEHFVDFDSMEDAVDHLLWIARLLSSEDGKVIAEQLSSEDHEVVIRYRRAVVKR